MMLDLLLLGPLLLGPGTPPPQRDGDVGTLEEGLTTEGTRETEAIVQVSTGTLTKDLNITMIAIVPHNHPRVQEFETGLGHILLEHLPMPD